MIHGHCLHNQQEEARRYFDDMMDRGISPNTVTFSILIDSHCKDGMTEDAWGLFKLMDKINIEPNQITYNSMMDGLCLTGQLQLAVKLFDSMVDRGLEPNEFNYNVIINGYCKNRKLDEALQLFKKMKQNGLRPTTVVYNTVLWGLYRVGRVRTAESLFSEMQSFGQSPNEVTYATMMNGLCKNGKLEKAIDLFESMEGIGVLADIEMYSILIHGLCQAGKLEDARKLFIEIPNKGLTPNVVTYNTMIKGLCCNKMLADADALIIEMEEKGCLPNARTYDTIINGFLTAKEPGKALRFLRQMRERNLSPRKVDHGFCLLGEIIKRGYHPDTVTFNTLIKGLCIKGGIEPAFKLFAEMTHTGIRPDAYTCNALIHGLCKTGEVGLAIQLKIKMVKWNCRPNDVSYSVILDALCKGELVDEAVILFSEMLRDINVVPNVVVYTSLISGLCNSGRFKIGGTSLNVSKSRKRPAAALTTPERPLKRRQSVMDTVLEAASRQRPQSLIQAKRSLLLDDAEKQQSSVPPHNDVEDDHRQLSTSRQLSLPQRVEFGDCSRQRSTSACHPTSVQRSCPRASPRRQTQLARNERDSAPRRSPLRHTLLARDEHDSTPRRSPRLSRRQQNQLDDNEDISPELSRRGFSHEASNSPLASNSANPPAIKTTRGITTLPKVAIRDTDLDKLKVEVFEKSLVGTFSLECILAIGMWVRQGDNFPLTVRLFRNMPEEKISRVSKLVRDYYILVPDDENDEEAIRTQMRLAYVRYRSELASHYRSFDSHEEALRNPSPRIRNVDDWDHMCDFFNTDVKFKAASEKARAARKALALNHTNGTQSFARKAYDRARKNLPIDPLSMFMETHKASKLGKLCADWQTYRNPTFTNSRASATLNRYKG
ncbi:hypothetical protein C5167_040647 [Papaver somniferum]|uniref:Pentatricopeptide repeat-containing protein n=1 Tax=Papaver somniferum TaxID=3469 RepID=A0A4Y7IJN4_PAPSO|nr:hypothetical protein C5167_040647 [Papaver somniferum]